MPLIYPKPRSNPKAGASGTLSVSAGLSANTKKSYADLITDTGPYPCNNLELTFYSAYTDAVSRRFIADIGIGATPTTMISDIYWRDEYTDQYSTGTSNIHSPYGSTISFPVDIPPNSKISVRHQCGTSTTTTMGIRAACSYEGELGKYGIGTGVWDTLGTTSAGSTVTVSNPTPSATAWAWGAWSNITTSTPTVYKALIVRVDAGPGADGSGEFMGLQIGLSLDGVTYTSIAEFVTSQGGAKGFETYVIPCSIPAGIYIAARCNSSRTSSGSTVRPYVFAMRGA